MNEMEHMDQLLRATLASNHSPELPDRVLRKVHCRLDRSLLPGQQWLLIAYCCLALTVSFFLMRFQALSWISVVLSIAIPLLSCFAFLSIGRPG